MARLLPPGSTGQITVGFLPNPPILLKIRVKAGDREMVMDTVTTTTDVQRHAELPGAG